ncbi:MAG: histidine kinase [Gammaproteobacteria bacterium]
MPVETKGTGRREDGLFLPDLCTPSAVLAVVLIAELVALVLALAAHPGNTAFWDSLARISLFLLWCALLSAALLCVLRPRLAALEAGRASAAAMAVVLAVVAAVSVGAWWMGRWWEGLPPLLASPAVQGLSGFVLTNVIIAAIVTGLTLRYFWVADQWRRNVQAEARARIDALQARIRPHFLFNSMNTIAALTRAEPRLAEEAVEDLADLFRASLADAGTMLSLKEELELCRVYQRIEQHRLGDRLSVDWQISELPMRARVPALSLQPLMENAIYHGVEPSTGGGTVSVEGRYDPEAGTIHLTVENPLPAGRPPGQREGNRMALENLRQRFALAWGEQAGVSASAEGDRYRVTLHFPATEEAP